MQLIATRRPKLTPIFWPGAVYVALALVQLFPFASRRLTLHWEIDGFIAGVVEARNALLEGQFPLRVAPHQHDGARYPVFQFYGNLQYTIAGLIHLLPGVDPYLAWKWVMFAALVIGGAYVYRCARQLTAHRKAAAWSGILFLTAPYMFADLRARGAVSETIAFCLLPVATFYTLKCFVRGRPRDIVASALAWTALALAHNITYFYAGLFLTAFFLACAAQTKRYLRRLSRLAAAAILHSLLVLWYFVPQLYVLSDLRVSTVVSPNAFAWLTPWWVLLARVRTMAPRSTTAGMGLQVGWPILAMVVGGLWMVLFYRRHSRRRLTIILLLLWTIAFVGAWSPVDFWRHLPKALYFIEFPYRLLVFVVFFGSLLSAEVLSRLFSTRFRGWVTLALAAMVALPCTTYVLPLGSFGKEKMAALIQHPQMGGPGDYLFTSAALRRTEIGPVTHHPSIDRVRYGRITRYNTTVSSSGVIELPVLYYPRMLRVRDNGKPVAYGNSGEFVAIPASPGNHEIEISFAGVGWANVLSAIAASGVAVALAAMAFNKRLKGNSGMVQRRHKKHPSLMTSIS